MVTEDNGEKRICICIRKLILISCEAIKLSKPDISGPSRTKITN